MVNVVVHKIDDQDIKKAIKEYIIQNLHMEVDAFHDGFEIKLSCENQVIGQRRVHINTLTHNTFNT